MRLDVPLGDVESLERGGDATPPKMTANILGLAGVLGPLPINNTDRLYEEANHNRSSFADFLDIFNHRLMALLFRARRKFRPALDRRGPDDGYPARVFFSLLGLGMRDLRGRVLADGTGDRALLPYTGLFTESFRSPAGLERILEDYFGVPARIETFKGGWDALEPDDWTAIGVRTGRNNVLGRTALIGRRVPNAASSFEVLLGPLGLESFRSFLPTGNAFRKLTSLIRFYAHQELGFTLRLVLRAEEMPHLHIRARGGDAYLGYTTWLSRRTPQRDDDKVRITGMR